MELMSLHCPPAARLPPRLARGSPPLMERARLLSGRPLPSRGTCSGNRRCPDARGPKSLDFGPRAAGPAQGVTGPSLQTAGDTKELSVSDGKLAFVAGATGRVGSRTVRELLKLGFSVRAGVRNAQRAEPLVQSVRQMKLDDASQSASEIQPVQRLEIVECNLENPQEIGPAIGGASIVICCIGASEKEVFDVTGPYRIDYKASENLIKAATVAKVDHFILVTSLGTNKIGFPASLLNLFWGVLYWKRKAEEALIASDLPYTIVRPGGMERPTDAFKETHNVILADGDTYFGGLVSNLQVAELIAFMAKNISLSFCKVVEVIAETTAPLKLMGELLAKIPSQRVDTPLLKDKLDPTATSVASPSTDDVKEELAQVEVLKTKPLSSYTVYQDLKPPTSPAPTASTARGIDADSGTAQLQTSPTIADITEKESVPLDAVKPRPLSPYVAYEDLKPPTSPTPTPSSASDGQKETKVDIASSVMSGIENGTTISTPSLKREEENVQAQAQAQDSSHRSPYPMYDDFKPPTSPSPSAPSISPASADSTAGASETSSSASSNTVSSSYASEK